jgi:hypothetical protein
LDVPVPERISQMLVGWISILEPVEMASHIPKKRGQSDFWYQKATLKM